jgi:hypothetical protein
MNTVNRVSRTVHHGLRLTSASELTGAHTPGRLRLRGLNRVTSTRRGASEDPHHELQQQRGDEDKADNDDQSGGGLEFDEGQHEVGRGKTGGSNELWRKWMR